MLYKIVGLIPMLFLAVMFFLVGCVGLAVVIWLVVGGL